MPRNDPNFFQTVWHGMWGAANSDECEAIEEACLRAGIFWRCSCGDCHDYTRANCADCGDTKGGKAD